MVKRALAPEGLLSSQRLLLEKVSAMGFVAWKDAPLTYKVESSPVGIGKKKRWVDRESEKTKET